MSKLGICAKIWAKTSLRRLKVKKKLAPDFENMAKCCWPKRNNKGKRRRPMSTQLRNLTFNVTSVSIFELLLGCLTIF